MSSRPGVAILLGSALFAAGCDRQASPAGQADSAADGVPRSGAPDEVTAAPAPPPAPAGAFDRSHKGEPAPAATFLGPDGRPATLAGFRGEPALVNLWATWCAPCVAEMPTLAAVQAKLRDKVRVVTISQDLDETPATVTAFLSARKLALPAFRDPRLALGAAYAANLPVTVLYDREGREVWRRAGGFKWDSPEALRMISEAQ